MASRGPKKVSKFTAVGLSVTTCFMFPFSKQQAARLGMASGWFRGDMRSVNRSNHFSTCHLTDVTF
eukprot:478414-Pyramimonas_sp.AAC.1